LFGGVEKTLASDTATQASSTPNLGEIIMPQKRNRFVLGGPVLSLIVLAVALVVLLSMEHFH
jgi:hypothetical protein